MDETAVIARLRAQGRVPVDPIVASAHLDAIRAESPAVGLRPRNLVAAAVAFAVLAGGAVSIIAATGDDAPKPRSPAVGSTATPGTDIVVDVGESPGP